MIEAKHLTKRYGKKVAVDEVSFTVQSGHVTGFLGPNGAGKSTTMRMILGLDAPTSGDRPSRWQALPPAHRPSAIGRSAPRRQGHRRRPQRRQPPHVAGRQQRHRPAPGGRSARLVGLGDVAGKRVGSFSLGMSQRLGIAAALLGDPETVIFDEPINGLDPEGILWIRNLMKSLASEGRTVFLSSHLMSEMAQTADHLLVIGRGRIIADATTDEFVNRHTAPSVRVRALQQTDLAEALTRRGALIECGSDGAMVVTGSTPPPSAERRPPTTSPSSSWPLSGRRSRRRTST